MEEEQEPLGRLLYLTTMALKNYIEQRVKPYDLTAEQFQILKWLALADGVVQGQLCTMVMKSPANMTRILDRLEKKGCIERRGNPDDRRSSLVFLQEQGRQLLADVLAGLGDCEAEITAGLTTGEVLILRQSLERIRANMTGGEEQTDHPGDGGPGCCPQCGVRTGERAR